MKKSRTERIKEHYKEKYGEDFRRGRDKKIDRNTKIQDVNSRREFILGELEYQRNSLERNRKLYEDLGDFKKVQSIDSAIRENNEARMNVRNFSDKQIKRFFKFHSEYENMFERYEYMNVDEDQNYKREDVNFDKVQEDRRVFKPKEKPKKRFENKSEKFENISQDEADKDINSRDEYGEVKNDSSVEMSSSRGGYKDQKTIRDKILFKQEEAKSKFGSGYKDTELKRGETLASIAHNENRVREDAKAKKESEKEERINDRAKENQAIATDESLGGFFKSIINGVIINSDMIQTMKEFKKPTDTGSITAMFAKDKAKKVGGKAGRGAMVVPKAPSILYHTMLKSKYMKSARSIDTAYDSYLENIRPEISVEDNVSFDEVNNEYDDLAL